jgi:hypothetical protein
MDKLQDEMIRIQTKYQRELEHLERENKELRKQLLLYKANKMSSKKVKVLLHYHELESKDIGVAIYVSIIM